MRNSENTHSGHILIFGQSSLPWWAREKVPAFFKGMSYVVHMFKYLAILFNAGLSFKIEFKLSEFAVC